MTKPNEIFPNALPVTGEYPGDLKSLKINSPSEGIKSFLAQKYCFENIHIEIKNRTFIIVIPARSYNRTTDTLKEISEELFKINPICGFVFDISIAPEIKTTNTQIAYDNIEDFQNLKNGLIIKKCIDCGCDVWWESQKENPICNFCKTGQIESEYFPLQTSPAKDKIKEPMKLKKLEIDPLKTFTLELKINVKKMRVRVFIATQILKVAGWFIPLKVEVKENE